MKPQTNIRYRQIKSEKPLSDFVKSFWKFENLSQNDYNSIILPDGCCDVLVKLIHNKLQKVLLTGIWTKPVDVCNPAGTSIIGIRFKLLGLEYILQQNISGIVNNERILGNSFWNIDTLSMSDFDGFVKDISMKMNSILGSGKGVDNRKLQMFRQIYETNGSISVEEIEDKVIWSKRQINRYFNDKFGLSLKAYCNIIKVYKSYKDIKKGKLFPDLNYYDQSHFIKEIKKHTGTNPKDLNKNKNDRFLQLYTMDDK